MLTFSNIFLKLKIKYSRNSYLGIDVPTVGEFASWCYLTFENYLQVSFRVVDNYKEFNNFGQWSLTSEILFKGP